MKIHTYALFLLVFIAASVPVLADGYFGSSPMLSLLVEEVSPEPVEPGQDLMVKIRIINEGGREAENVRVVLQAEEPFILKTSSKSAVEGQRLCVGCSMETTYHLSVDASAISGTYPLSFDIIQGSTSTRSAETIDIRVVGKPDLIVAAHGDAVVVPGEELLMTFTIENVGTGVARTIKLLPDTDKVVMLGTNLEYTDRLAPGDQAEKPITFFVRQSLDPDTYTFPVILTYVDELGDAYEQEYQVGVNVLHEAEIAVQSLKTSPTFPVLGDTLRFEGIIENTGRGDADGVRVMLIADGKNESTFLGQLAADDDAPFYFETQPGLGSTDYTVIISYEDDLGTHEQSITKEVVVAKPKQKAVTIAAILAAIAIGALIWWMKRRGKR